MDAVRGKVTTKIAREITIAVKMGGGADPTGNTKLKLALQKAKSNNVPKENIQRAIQKGLGAGDADSFTEISYEGYGPAGVAVLVNALTDNRNRTAADVRHLFSKYGGNLGESGSVGWLFNKKGLLVVEADKVSEEDLMLITLEAGAEDIQLSGEAFEIYTAPEDYDQVEQALADNNLEILDGEIAMIPTTSITLRGDEAVKMQKLLDALEELDDVQDVFSNADLPEDDDEE